MGSRKVGFETARCDNGGSSGGVGVVVMIAVAVVVAVVIVVGVVDIFFGFSAAPGANMDPTRGGKV